MNKSAISMKIRIASEIMHNGFTMTQMMDFFIRNGIKFVGGEKTSKKKSAEESMKLIKDENKLNNLFLNLLDNKDWKDQRPNKLLNRLSNLIGNVDASPRWKATKYFTIDNLHPMIKKASRGLFEDDHFSQAVFEAFKALNNEVKRISGLTDEDGVSLMYKALSPNGPKIKFNNLQTKTELDEQQGFMNLFAGAIAGLRNPRGHDRILDDPLVALQMLSLASLLMAKLTKRVYP